MQNIKINHIFYILQWVKKLEEVISGYLSSAILYKVVWMCHHKIVWICHHKIVWLCHNKMVWMCHHEKVQMYHHKIF